MDAGRKILIVDDDPTMRSVVSKMLSWLGYHVSTAESGENGLSIFLKNKFDIVISDYEMPGMTGAVLAHCIKTRSPSTPVVLMTGSGKEIVLSQKGPAVDRVLFKPFTLSEIDETIQGLFGNAST